jgi:DNA-binding GntR family transcriptional regulator
MSAGQMERVSTLEQAEGGAVSRAARAVRNLILRRTLVPGQQVRQEDLAQELSVSRGPLREALRVLEAEGVLQHIPNRGYYVTQYTADEMKQVYLIRDLLESEILGSLPVPNPEYIRSLRACNDRIREPGVEMLDVVHLNSEFHNRVMDASPLKLLVAEVKQIGHMSVAYQALSINVLPDWSLVADDHDAMIAAIEAYNLGEVVALARMHRDRTLERLLPVLL